MNITPQFNYAPLATTVNPPTDNLRRENNMREVITAPVALNPSAAEKPVASDKEKVRTPGQYAEFIDFSGLKEQQEQEETTIGDSSQNSRNSSGQSSEQSPGQGGEQSSEQNPEQNSEQATQGEEQAQDQKNDVEAAAEQQKIQALQSRDQEVRAHELAHASVGGSATGSPSYTFQVGPDGKKYAVGGEVSVDLSPVSGDPQATISKMQKVYAAALAPANPSSQDNRVAATASKIILQAQTEISGADPRTSAPSTNVKMNEGEETAESSESVGTSTSVDSLTGVESLTSGESSTSIKSSASSESDFDTMMTQTLEAQEQIVPTRSAEVDQRASRVETFYLKINQAYEKPPTYQFQLTA